MILALDLGTRTGWALGDHAEHPTVGHQDFSLKRGDSPGMRFLRLRMWLNEIWQLSHEGIELVVYEQPHLRGGAAATVLVGMEAIVLAWAASKKLQHSSVHTSTLKKWATGKGNASKEDMIQAAKTSDPSFDPASDDEADAYWLLCYALSGRA